MKLKTKYENQDDIPEAHRELFEEKDGRWILTGIEGANDADAVKRLGDQRDKERKRANDAEAKLKRFEKLGDKDPEELLKLADEVEDLKGRLEEAEEAKGKGGKVDEDALQKRIDREVNKQVNPLKRQLTDKETELAKIRAEADEHKATAAALDGRIRRGTLEQELSRKALELKVRPEAIADVLRYQDVFEIDEDGKTIRTRDGVGVAPGIDVASWLSDMKSTRPHWWPDSVGGGSKGADGKGSASDNPFAKGAFNLSKAGALIKTDPAKATTLAKQAGFSSVDAAIKAGADAKAGAR